MAAPVRLGCPAARSGWRDHPGGHLPDYCSRYSFILTGIWAAVCGRLSAYPGVSPDLVTILYTKVYYNSIVNVHKDVQFILYTFVYLRIDTQYIKVYNLKKEGFRCQ